MKSIVPIVIAIIGVAALAAILSSNSNTSNVISQSGSGLASAIRCALSPVTGGTCAGSSSSLPIGFSTTSITYPGLNISPAGL